MALNRVILMGRISRDLELRQTTTGVSVLQFSIAVDRRRSSKDAEKKTDFIECIAWRETAEFISRYFHKGKLIVVEGSLQVDEWTDKGGNKRKTTKVSVQSAHFCGDKSAPSNNQQGYQQPQYQMQSQVGYFDDLTADQYDLPGEFGGDVGDGDLPF